MATFGQRIQLGPYNVDGVPATIQVYHYAAGTSSLKDVYSDREKTTTEAQPVESDLNGIVSFFADGLYNIRIDAATDGITYSTIYTYDNWNIGDQGSLSGEGAAISSASTLTLGTDGDIFHVTGSGGPITAITGTQSYVTLIFDSTPTLNHSGNLILQGAVNHVATAGSTMQLINEGAGVFREVSRTPDLIAIGANGTVLTADSTNAYGAAWLSTGFTTGDVKLTFKTTVDTGWVIMNDLSIGDATSAATGRANADTSALYTLLWTNVTDQWAPVLGGRGGGASADFAAHKPMALPKTLGRALAGYGVGTVVASGVDADVDIGAANSLTVASNNTKWITGMSVLFTLASGTITGLTSGNTYYVIRSSATLVQLASSLANAQNGTAIDITAKSAPVWTITHTYTTRVLGEAIGESTHAQSSTELLSHTHTPTTGAITSSAGVGNWNGGGAGATTTLNATGGNVAMNIMQPTTFLNVFIKL